MTKVRSWLLILTALLVVGSLSVFSASKAAAYQFDYATDPLHTPAPTTGEPDGSGGGIRTNPVPHSAVGGIPVDSGLSPATRTPWFEWAVRIWAARLLRGGW
jgi:hypothetical protein